MNPPVVSSTIATMRTMAMIFVRSAFGVLLLPTGLLPLVLLPRS